MKTVWDELQQVYKEKFVLSPLTEFGGYKICLDNPQIYFAGVAVETEEEANMVLAVLKGGDAKAAFEWADKKRVKL